MRTVSGSGATRTFRAHEKTVATKQFQVGDSRVELKTGASGLKRRTLILSAWRLGTAEQATIYIGDSSVTISNGYPLYTRDQLELQVDGSVGVYAIADVEEEETALLTIMELE